MKKKLILLTGTLLILLAIASVALAANQIQIVVNGRDIGVTGFLQDDRTFVPVRAVAEALHAQVNWTGSAVVIDSQPPDLDKINTRVSLLEQALLPTSPADAAQKWADGVKTRNGALQYAALTPGLRDKMQADFEGFFWVTGVSSPWVDSYEILKEEKINDDQWRYTIRFNLKTSTGDAGNNQVRIIVSRQVIYTADLLPTRDKPENWQVSRIETENEVSVYGVKVFVPEDWQISTTNAVIMNARSGARLGEVSELGSNGLPNHSQVLEERAFTTGLGTGRGVLLEMSEPAAAGSDAKWQEVHCLVPLNEHRWLDFNLQVEPDANGRQLLEDVIAMCETITLMN